MTFEIVVAEVGRHDAFRLVASLALNSCSEDVVDNLCPVMSLFVRTFEIGAVVGAAESIH